MNLVSGLVGVRVNGPMRLSADSASLSLHTTTTELVGGQTPLNTKPDTVYYHCWYCGVGASPDRDGLCRRCGR